jgi:hypothetical protein
MGAHDAERRWAADMHLGNFFGATNVKYEGYTEYPHHVRQPVAAMIEDRDLAIVRQPIFGQFSASKAGVASAGTPLRYHLPPSNNVKPDAKASESSASVARGLQHLM